MIKGDVDDRILWGAYCGVQYRYRVEEVYAPQSRRAMRTGSEIDYWKQNSMNVIIIISGCWSSNWILSVDMWKDGILSS